MDLPAIASLGLVQARRAGANEHKYYYFNLCLLVFIRGFPYPLFFFLFSLSGSRIAGFSTRPENQIFNVKIMTTSCPAQTLPTASVRFGWLFGLPAPDRAAPLTALDHRIEPCAYCNKREKRTQDPSDKMLFCAVPYILRCLRQLRDNESWL